MRPLHRLQSLHDGAVRVDPVRTPSDLNAFIKLPWSIYRGDPNWVPPLVMDQKALLSRDRNPFFRHAAVEYFLARRVVSAADVDGPIVGRIAAIHDPRYIDFQRENVGFFGFFETIDEQPVADALLAAARGWLRERHIDTMRGPTNPSTNDSLGTLVDRFDLPPVVMMPYNPPYYPRLLEQAGLVKAKDLLAYWLSEQRMQIDRLDRVVDLLKKRHNLTLRPLDLKRIDEEIALVKEIYNDAWERNWGFVPWTDEEIEHLGHELRPVADPELVMFAYKGDEPAGFSLSLPDLFQALIRVKSGRLFPFGLLQLLIARRSISQVRVLAMGIRHRYRGLGLDALFYHRTFRYAETKGMQRGECSWVLEDNHAMRSAIEKMGGEVYKTYRIYEQPVRDS
ncbi:MAG: N-acetyltransferase [Spirochaetaceae bacterium]|nr:MAG: N-acetyltransferase [Spirochaetaceae bacterium]